MPAPFSVRDQDNPGRDLGEWTEDGDIRLPGALILGTPGVQIDGPGDWSAVTYEANVTAAGAPYADPGTRIEGGQRVFLRGRVAWTGNFLGGATLFTVAHAPTLAATFSVRTGPTSNISTQLVVAAGTGAVSLVAATVNSGYLGLDGLSYER